MRALQLTKNSHLLHIALLILSVFAVYGQTLSYGFATDDLGIIEKPFFLTFGTYFRPAWSATCALDYFAFGYNAGGWHLTNILWHLLAVVLFYQLLWRLLERPFAAFFGALFWSAHAWNAYSVTWIAEREDIMATCFVLMAVLFFLTYADHLLEDGTHLTRHLVWACTFYFLSLLSKESALPLPAVLFGLLIYRFGGLSFLRSERRSSLRWISIPTIVAFSATLILYWVMRWALIGNLDLQTRVSVFDDPNLPLLVRVGGRLANYARSASHIFFPIQLGSTPLSIVLFIVGGTLALMLLTRFVLRRRDDRQSEIGKWGLVWLLVFLGPTLFKPEPRLLYLPSMGFALTVVVALLQLWDEQRLRWVLVFLVGIYGAHHVYASVAVHQQVFSPRSRYVLGGLWPGVKAQAYAPPVMSYIVRTLDEVGCLDDKGAVKQECQVEPDTRNFYLNDYFKWQRQLGHAALARLGFIRKDVVGKDYWSPEKTGDAHPQ